MSFLIGWLNQERRRKKFMLEAVVISEKDIEKLSERIYETHGYDFRGYAQASYKRRIHNVHFKLKCKNIQELSDKILNGRNLFDSFLAALSVPVTDMFRDPIFFRGLKTHVLPHLKSYPFFKIWHAGCATGEEVYSLAIFLQEAGLLQRAMIYATDFNPNALSRAKSGVIHKKDFNKSQINYKLAGGMKDLSHYGAFKNGDFVFEEQLREKMTFASHNLVQDGSFGVMNLILCRNTLIYFGKRVQMRVLRLFNDSLVHRGIFCLGFKESLDCIDEEQHFETWLLNEKIYKKRVRVKI